MNLNLITKGYMSVREVSSKWNISPRRIQKLCSEGRISGAYRLGNSWLIPESATQPTDPRKKTTSKINNSLSNISEHQVIPRDKLIQYIQSKKYTEILSLDFTPWIFEEIDSVSFLEIALDIYKEIKYNLDNIKPISALRLALALLTGKNYKEFDDLINEISHKLNIQEKTKDIDYLKADLHLLLAWRELPYLPKMIEHVKIATSLLGSSHSRLITPEFPWGFGVHTQLSLFHYIPGNLSEELENLSYFLKLYTPLTQGHGTGADVLMQAEIAHMQGNFQASEMLSYQASFLAQSKNQTIIQLGSAFLLAEISIFKSNPSTWEQAINFMEQAIINHPKNNFLHIEVELLRSCLLNELNLPDRLPDWIKTGTLSKKLPSHLYQGFCFIHANYLMHKQEYAKLVGCTKAFLELLSPTDFYIRTLFTLLCAIGHLGIGNIEKSEELLVETSQLIIQDDFLFLLSVYSWGLNNIPERLIRDRYPIHLAKYLEIKNQFLEGYNSLRQEYGETFPSDLTAREKEVAILASKGLRNTEISEKLMISENTVKYHLRSIFQKLDVDRRNKLAEKLNVL
ncbi:protein of unknown function [Acetoanaerobium sticklandii]|uniref:HTH luxR-type domain-containing protein n=1 Tax=Acetoanaerobium sticklandii (strain ATCC 12662 / DSM 519 / JCM 1433 / CCUG 9281 / NCIMB 10654 / HF) TaxID=499177 RepID=E3PUG2_ACESD|nr:LuxR C-terminal-related transcriptional regulator [Acetoanaerobium sticklandii]CBH22400.1 protein of unknown function [Acetoanaerobium sticklandii]